MTWTCPRCETVNQDNLDVCEVCDTKRVKAAAPAVSAPIGSVPISPPLPTATSSRSLKRNLACYSILALTGLILFNLFVVSILGAIFVYSKFGVGPNSVQVVSAITSTETQAVASLVVTATPQSEFSTATHEPTVTLRPTHTPRPISTNSLVRATPSPEACALVPAGLFSNIWRQFRNELGCPLTAEQAIQDAEQTFQGGHLFWRSDVDLYYAIYDGGKLTHGNWAVYSRHFGYIDNCPGDPPTGLSKPISGFGDIWCYLGGTTSPLGWATDHEYGFLPAQGIRIQDFQNGLVFQDSDGVQHNLVYVLSESGFSRMNP